MRKILISLFLLPIGCSSGSSSKKDRIPLPTDIEGTDTVGEGDGTFVDPNDSRVKPAVSQLEFYKSLISGAFSKYCWATPTRTIKGQTVDALSGQNYLLAYSLGSYQVLVLGGESIEAVNVQLADIRSDECPSLKPAFPETQSIFVVDQVAFANEDGKTGQACKIPAGFNPKNYSMEGLDSGVV
ncbi:MAG: hypothetical protein EOP04_31595, partial [Proteobacteria bacterium]